ncbi:unnamed protein product [Hymenolepis diminuta]|uniref:Uncharacterized protein n=1 Tax=Hymenolepis diminuta TaxID=6216 RepID=A0A564ZBB0_HYMDI|nr:unnamed protein product [Hymenolepis diminuta]
MKLLAPGESFDTDFWKLLYFKKLQFYIQPILANALKTEPIESLAGMADNIIETGRLPQSSFGKRPSPAVVAETVSGHSSNRLFLQDQNFGTSYLIDSEQRFLYSLLLPPIEIH